MPGRKVRGNLKHSRVDEISTKLSKNNVSDLFTPDRFALMISDSIVNKVSGYVQRKIKEENCCY